MSDGITESRRMIKELVLNELASFCKTHYATLENIYLHFQASSCPKDSIAFRDFLLAMADAPRARERWKYDKFWEV